MIAYWGEFNGTDRSAGFDYDHNTIGLAFYALQGLHMERWFRRPPKTLPLLTVLLATALGYLNAIFLLTVLKAIRNLIYLAQ